MHSHAGIVWNHCAGFDSGILLCSVDTKRQLIRLNLAQGIALALEFKMGGEVLRTVVVREWSELGILGAIIVLRAMLTFLIHWEIKNEKRETKEEQGEKPE